jgi:hypothetical protein
MDPHIAIKIKIDARVQVDLVQRFRPASYEKIVEFQFCYQLKFGKGPVVTKKIFIQNTVIISATFEHTVFKYRSLFVVSIFFIKVEGEFTETRANVVKNRIVNARKGVYVCY